jgi:hypothetical protein
VVLAGALPLWGLLRAAARLQGPRQPSAIPTVAHAA